jgi:selenide,water dikinase
LSPGDLDKALCGLELPKDENLIVGLERADDAGVYKISNELAIIQTVDFFTPIVDDPFCFGQIAVANALSDVYAMGGTPKTALNLVAFPIKDMGISILRQILEGGLQVMKEAGVVLLGGHSIEDKELKYGLAVTGFVHPNRVIQNTGLAPGDRLILTKPLGTGIINTAIKGGLASRDVIEAVSRLMVTLNRQASAVMCHYPVSACTDVTGFGLIGHLAEMVVDTPCGVHLNATEIPVIPETFEYAKIGFIPGGAFKNKEFRASLVTFADTVDPLMQDILFDPQTSGGLLIGIPEKFSESLLRELRGNGVGEAAIIGDVTREPSGKILVT